MFSAISNIFSEVVGKALDGFFSTKQKEAEKVIRVEELDAVKKKIEADLRIKLAEEMNKPDSELRKFMLDYEGKATEMPRVIQILRGSVRPVVTYWSIGLISYIMLKASAGAEIGANMKDIPGELWVIFLAIFGFWFGGRAVEQAVETHQKGKLMQKQAEVNGQIEQSKEQSRQELARKEAEKQKTKQILAKSGVIPQAPAPKTKNPIEEAVDYWDDLDWE